MFARTSFSKTEDHCSGYKHCLCSYKPSRPVIWIDVWKLCQNWCENWKGTEHHKSMKESIVGHSGDFIVATKQQMFILYSQSPHAHVHINAQWFSLLPTTWFYHSQLHMLHSKHDPSLVIFQLESIDKCTITEFFVNLWETWLVWSGMFSNPASENNLLQCN